MNMEFFSLELIERDTFFSITATSGPGHGHQLLEILSLTPFGVVLLSHVGILRTAEQQRVQGHRVDREEAVGDQIRADEDDGHGQPRMCEIKGLKMWSLDGKISMKSTEI